MKNIKKFKQFNEGIVNWKQEDLDKAIDILFHIIEHAEEMLGVEDLAPEDAIIKLKDRGTDESIELANEIDRILDLIAQFDVESEIEQSKLN